MTSRILRRIPVAHADPVPSRPSDRIDVRAAFPAIRATIAVCGAASNAGKTWLCEAILRGLQAEGVRSCALKVTRTHLGDCPRGVTTCGTCDSLAGAFELVRDEARLHVPRKDTGRYHDAGADQVLWLLVKPASVREGLLSALANVPAGSVLVAEGNSFRDYASADVTLMALAGDGALKESARRVLDRIDARVRSRRAPATSDTIAPTEAWDFVRARLFPEGPR